MTSVFSHPVQSLRDPAGIEPDAGGKYISTDPSQLSVALISEESPLGRTLYTQLATLLLLLALGFNTPTVIRQPIRVRTGGRQ